MAVAQVDGVWKSFNGRAVVRDVSFTVEEGEVLATVGPNGAGKTTTIRMLLDIIKPDRGQVLLFGAPFSPHHRRLLGYLPEERGLYQGLPVLETLEYLGALKGLGAAEARARARAALERVGMWQHRSARVGQLSRGMAQLVQFAAATAHLPRLLVLDEPFSGLDPVNVRLLKEVLLEMRRQGTAIILSTHQMNQVEELGDRVLMIDQGRAVLYGPVDEVRRGYGQGSVVLECSAHPGELPGVQSIADSGGRYELALEEGASTQAVLESLLERGIQVRRFEVSALPLEEVFVRVVRSGR